MLAPKLRVEPASGLVVALGDEVGRPPLFEFLLLSREVQSCPGGHGAVEPDIEDIRRSLHLASAWAVYEDIVHIRPVQVWEPSGRFSPLAPLQFR